MSGRRKGGASSATVERRPDALRQVGMAFARQGVGDCRAVCTGNQLVPEPMLGHPRNLLLPGKAMRVIQDTTGDRIELADHYVPMPVVAAARGPAFDMLHDNRTFRVEAELAAKMPNNADGIVTGRRLGRREREVADSIP
jgi:hypothetical protein